MIRLEIKNCNMILKEKQQKYQHYHLEKLIDINILQVKELLTFYQRQIIEQSKCVYSPLWQTFEKQIKTNEKQGRK